MTPQRTLSRLVPLALIAGLALAGLAGCSDSPDPEPPIAQVPPQALTDVPATAASSTRAYTTFAAGLPRTETGAPLGMSQIATVPTSETEAPLPI